MGIATVQGAAPARRWIARNPPRGVAELPCCRATPWPVCWPAANTSITGLGTVTYNDGKRILAFGHPFFNLGPVDMPMSKGEILFTNASASPAEQIRQCHRDRGRTPPGPPQRHHGRARRYGRDAARDGARSFFAEDNTIRKQHDFHFNVFVQQKWTPFLMMMTLFNSINGLNNYMDECTYRVSGKIGLAGDQKMSVSTMQAPGEMSVPAP